MNTAELDEILRLTDQRDKAKALLREMAEHLKDAHAPALLGALKWRTERDELLRRAKEMTND